MALFARKKRILAKIEVTYGTDSSPTGSEAMLTKNLTLSDPYGGDRVTRDFDTEALGLDTEINVNPFVQCTFDVEIAGAGSAAVTAGTAPGYGVLLRACGFDETITATTDTQYAPVSASFESASIYFIVDGQQHTLLGARGSVSFNFAKGAIPSMTFTMTGRYATPTAAGAITPDVSAFQDPLPVTMANTTLTMGGLSLPTESLTCDMANNVVPRNIIASEEILITDRQPTGQVAFEAPVIGTNDIFTDWVESHAGTINTIATLLTHGTATGDIVVFSAPQTQVSALSEQDSDGLLVYQGTARYTRTAAGDDEILITVK